MKSITASKHPLLKHYTVLGESPVYEKETNVLHFVDIGRCEVHHLQLDHTSSEQNHTIDVYEDPVSCIRLRKGKPGFVAVATHGFAFLPPSSPGSSHTNPTPVPYHTLAQNPNATSSQMFNDGEIDPQGRFLAGTKIKRGLPVKLEPREGTLFRFDRRGQLMTSKPGGSDSVEMLLEGLTIPNGIGFSKNGQKMFIADTLVHTIWSFDYDGTNADTNMATSNGSSNKKGPSQPGTGLNNKRLLINTKHEPNGGLPDGLLVDADDQIWSAKFRGARIHRYDPQTGKPTFEIVFPTAYNITCLEFGGEDLSTLYVTTASLEESASHKDEGMRRTFCESGAVFKVELGEYQIKGKEKYRFDG